MKIQEGHRENHTRYCMLSTVYLELQFHDSFLRKFSNTFQLGEKKREVAKTIQQELSKGKQMESIE